MSALGRRLGRLWRWITLGPEHHEIARPYARYLFIPEVADPSAPTVAELNQGIDITGLMSAPDQVFDVKAAFEAFDAQNADNPYRRNP